MNGLNFAQSAAILTAVFKQATGQNAITPVNSDEFVSMAQTTLQTGYNNVMESLSIVLTRTFFSVRPYSRKLKGLRRDSQKWGNHVRKITFLDQDMDATNDQYNLTDGESLDPFVIKKPKAVQMNFYAGETHSDHITRFENQIDTALSSPEEFGAFVTACMQELSDKFTQIDESADRLLVCNLIAGKQKADSDNVISLLTEYYNETGTYLVNDVSDSRHYANKANIDDFSKWVAGYINTISDKMTNRTIKYHMNLSSNRNIPRHTPKAYQNLYVYSPVINGVKTRVLSNTFNEGLVRIGTYEEVDYWQSFNTPDQVKVKPAYIDANGEEVNGASSANTTVNNVFAVLFDDDCIGSTIIDTRSGSIYNPRGAYFNLFMKWTRRYYEDLTENCVVFLLSQTAQDPSVMAVSPTTLSIAKGSSKTVTVTYPQGTVSVSATGTGISASYSADTGKVTVAVAADASAETGTVTITDTVTTKTVSVTVTT